MSNPMGLGDVAPPPPNIPLAAGGPPIIATRMMAMRAQVSRDLGYPDGKLAAWWQVLERLLNVYDGWQQEARGRE